MIDYKVTETRITFERWTGCNLPMWGLGTLLFLLLASLISVECWKSNAITIINAVLICCLAIPVAIFYEAGQYSLDIDLVNQTYASCKGFRTFPITHIGHISEFNIISIAAKGDAPNYILSLHTKGNKPMNYILHGTEDIDAAKRLAQKLAMILNIEVVLVGRLNFEP